MFGKASILAIIPARSGSKRLPGKNLMPLLGKPMIAWTIDASRNSRYIDKTMVSTEDDEISAIAIKHGAEVPFLRPRYLATDEAKTISVVRDVLLKYKELGEEFDYVAILQPTSPLRTSHHIDEAIEMLVRRKASSVIGVVKEPHPIEWVNRLRDDGSMIEFLHAGVGNTRCQDYEERYRICGAIYICKSEMITSDEPKFIDEDSLAYIMDEVHSLDIDTKLDFQLAEYILTKKNHDLS